jgi:serine protease Do
MRASLLVAALLLMVMTAAEARSWAWLGVRIRDLSEQEMEEIAARHGVREGFGAVIVEVLEGSPASRAGLRNGDLVVAVEGRPVTETRVLQRLIGAAPVGQESRLTVLRADGRRQVAVRLAAMPPDVAGDRVAAEFGFVLREPELPGPLAGAVPGAPAVAGVLRGSAAEKAGMQVGDVLLRIGELAVASREAARTALAEVPLDGPLTLTVRRGESHFDVRLAPAVAPRSP